MVSPTYREIGIHKRDAILAMQLAEIAEDSPEDYQRILTGETTLKKVLARRKKQERRAKQEKVEEERRRNPSPVLETPNLVLADPPWAYNFAATDSRQIENQYETATVETIISHAPKTQEDAVLFLWATAPKLREALAVMEGWGFSYRTHAIWDKVSIGMGYWFRGTHEMLLVGVKGKFSPPDEKYRVVSIFREKRTRHSKKPECVYEWIERAFPGTVRLEVYARGTREGWQSWGYEARIAK